MTTDGRRSGLVFVGSLRRESFSRKVARALINAAPPPLDLAIAEIGQLPLYNADLEADPPSEWRAFRERVRAADAFLFVTPEYNRSMPGVLKNALDVGSRPSGHSSWRRRPGAVVSVSTGGIGGFGANHHLRQSLVFLDVPAMPQPEAYVGGADKLFDAGGTLINESTRAFFTTFMTAFAAWIELNPAA